MPTSDNTPTIYNKDLLYYAIFEIFYFKNFTCPEKEVDKFWNNYQGTDWVNKNGAKILDPIAIAKNWEQKPKGKAIPEKLLLKWNESFNIIKNTNPEIAHYFLYIKPVVIDGDTITFSGLKENILRIEREAVKDFKNALIPVFGNIKVL